MLLHTESAKGAELIKVGGQAVIEGIMMRAPKTLTIVVRKPDGQLSVREDRWYSPMERWPALKKPFLRGCIVLYEALFNGIQALSFSAQEAVGEEEEKLSPWALGGTILFAIGAALGLFVVIPHLATVGMGVLFGKDLTVKSLWFHVIDGVIKVAIFVGYIYAISLMKEIRRVFQYHGAEHKSIHAYEQGEELTVENARKYPTLHARCGTAFIMLVLLVSIFLFLSRIPLLPERPFWEQDCDQLVLHCGQDVSAAAHCRVFLRVDPLWGASEESSARRGIETGLAAAETYHPGTQRRSNRGGVGGVEANLGERKELGLTTGSGVMADHAGIVEARRIESAVRRPEPAACAA